MPPPLREGRHPRGDRLEQAEEHEIPARAMP